MASYVVMVPPGGAAAAPEERARAVRDGFAVFAFLAPLLWFLWHRMWIEALATLVVAVGLGLLSRVDAVSAALPVISLAVSALFGLEAQTLRMAALRRRGWRSWGVVEAGSRDEAEARYVAEAVAAQEARAASPAPARPAVANPPAGVPGRPPRTGPAFGLLDYPWKR